MYDRQIVEEISGLNQSENLQDKVKENFDTSKADSIISSSNNNETQEYDEEQSNNDLSNDEAKNVLVLCRWWYEWITC